jgi:hypothetical protein
MSISRKLPTSNKGRDKALKTAKDKNDSLAAADRFLTAATQTRMNNIQSLIRTAMQNSGVALANQVGSSTTVEEDKERAKMHNSHFIQAFDNGAQRGDFDKAHRAHFSLPTGNTTLPRMVTEQEILQVGDNIVDGDVTRLGAGGAAMSNPTTAAVATAISTFRTSNNAQSNFKDAYDNSLTAINNLVPEADAVIKKIWDEVETFYNEETPSSKRRKGREWGEIFISDVEITFNIIIVNNADNAAIENAACELVETNNEKNSGPDGRLVITSNITGSATFSAVHPDFVPKEVTVELPDGQTVFNVEIRMDHV